MQLPTLDENRAMQAQGAVLNNSFKGAARKAMRQ